MCGAPNACRVAGNVRRPWGVLASYLCYTYNCLWRSKATDRSEARQLLQLPKIASQPCSRPRPHRPLLRPPAAAACFGDFAGQRTANFLTSTAVRDASIVSVSGPIVTLHFPSRTVFVPAAFGTVKSRVPSGSSTVADAPGASGGVRVKPRSALSGKPSVPCVCCVCCVC